MNPFHWTRGALCASLLTVAGAGHAQSYYGLGTAPDELASYGYAYGVQILDDETAIYYLAEYDPQPTNPNPPEAAIIALHKGNDNRAFIAVEPAPATDANGAAVPGRRIAAAETDRFNRIIYPAVARAHPPFARTKSLDHFIYAGGRHFQPTRFFRERQELSRTTHEEPLLVLLWERAVADQPFAPHPRLLAGVPADWLTNTIAEAMRDRAPLTAVAARRTAPPATPAAAPVVSASRSRATGRAANPRTDIYVDLAHYSPQSLHSEAVAGSRNNGIVVVAFTDETAAREMQRVAANYIRAGALIRSVMRAAPMDGMNFDIYYNGASLFQPARSPARPVGSFESALRPIVELQSVDMRMAEKLKEIEDLERKVEAMDRAFELGGDPDINK